MINTTKYKLQSSIETLISQHKAARLSTLEARKLLEQAEAAEHSLLLSIEAWAESNRFDIRLLDESEEKPELVITDWRDLRVGDVVIYEDGLSRDLAGAECIVSRFDQGSSNRNVGVIPITENRIVWPFKWRFIRRPKK